MSIYPAGQINISGHDYPIEVNERGTWACPSLRIEAATRNGLEEKAKRATAKAKVKVEVPFTALQQTYGSATLRDYTATGLHAGTGNVMIRDNKTGKSSQLPGYHYGKTLRRLADEEKQAGHHLLEAHIAAKRAWDKWLSDHLIDLEAEVTRAVERKMSES
jgi:hypothetical protein